VGVRQHAPEAGQDLLAGVIEGPGEKLRLKEVLRGRIEPRQVFS
jgi:hypothetical protein